MTLTRQPAYWLFVCLVFGGLGLVGLEQANYFASQPAAWILSILLLVAVAVPVGLIIYRIDQFEPEPASLIAVALLWGGIVALSFSALANSSFLGFFQNILPAGVVKSWGAALVAPIDEEFYKGAGLLMIYFMARDEIDGLMDGLVYGAMIGLGFQVVENLQYFLLAAAESGGAGLGAVAGMFFIRVLVAGLYSHMLFTGLFGFGFAYFVTRRGKVSVGRRAAVLAVFIVASWAAHFVWNSPWLDTLAEGGVGVFVASLVIKGLPFLVLLGIMVYVARRRESQAFARLMAEEVGGDVVTREEFEVLRSGRRRRKVLRRIKKQRGSAGKRAAKRLMRAQMDLALFHSKTAASGHPAVEAQRDKIRELKAQLAATPSRTS